MTTTIIIPARFAAQRFPAKLVQDLCGKPVIQHTWEAAKASKADKVLIAADSPEIATAAQAFGGEVIMTGEHHSGSDRVCEAACKIGLTKDDTVINLQGDEPLFASSDIDLLIDKMQQHSDIGMGSMMHRLDDENQFNDPGCVKVVVNKNMKALYFSRSPIPYARNQTDHHPWLHQGIYAFRLHTLQRIVKMPPSSLEQIEQLEQLRALYNGIDIYMVESKQPAHPGIDTPENLQYAIEVLQQTK